MRGGPRPGVAGAVFGWLLFGWASRRTESRGATLRALANALYGFAVLFWCLPIGWATPLLLAHHRREAHHRWHPLWEWLGQPVAALPFLLAAGAALAGLAVAALPTRTPAPSTDGPALA
ncbi:MAG TPA: hypothetical protein VFT95_22295 [Micromonosporaceae bacterium]|nr:hypothetical protein [Micromonosporaceae bacterium]